MTDWTTDRPTFDEPWQARIFALAVQLNETGVFEWSEFAAALGARLAGSADRTGADYYRCWHAALTDVLGVRGLLPGTE
ncbi:nitrile hydratase accessory protein [Granulicoccus sp. GXG6511]|uniref:nitrile hydratase accessory protein n=1 Tax=Granulicoccus sp. GXG6511 TaxID=3381351 RepID=UPI003D7DD522